MEPLPPQTSASSHAAHNSDDAAGNGVHGAGNTTTVRDGILLHPDVHVGSVSKRTRTLWVHDGRGRMEQREVTYVPALIKVFDEVLLHAADTKRRRDPAAAMDVLRVDVDAARGSVSVYCTGAGGVPIAVHPDMPAVYVPETIFGHLIANSEVPNNGGHGVKLANLFSTEFVVEIADGPGRRKYKQVFSDNMGKTSHPEVTGYNKHVSWTKVTFKPDLARFNMARLDEDDTLTLMRKRTFDMTGVLGAAVQVVFNGKSMLVPKGWPGYVFRYIVPRSKDISEERPWICEKANDHWEVGVSLTLDGEGLEQVSFVNNVATLSGGTHVDHVANKIAAHVVAFVKEKFEQYCGTLEEDDVKRHLMVFVHAVMENPTFDSPAREALITPQEQFGSECELSDLFYKKVRGSRLLARLLARRQAGFLTHLASVKGGGGDRRCKVDWIVQLALNLFSVFYNLGALSICVDYLSNDLCNF